MTTTDLSSISFYGLFGAFILLLAFWLLRSALHSSDHKRRVRASKDLRVHLIQVAQSSEISERQALWRTLTARENKVARLAAQDKTDMEIAQQLQISVRTVESHLYRVYRKLNIRSRHELKYIVQHLEE
ncbi:MAG: helix-turn-helix transcriptional regulator [Chloroflexi bacterium]|nr:helix-turn-helix transcriptional regulator [Chloroflexota bacterium]